MRHNVTVESRRSRLGGTVHRYVCRIDDNLEPHFHGFYMRDRGKVERFAIHHRQKEESCIPE